MKIYLPNFVIYFSIVLWSPNLVGTINRTGVTIDSTVSVYSTPIITEDSTFDTSSNSTLLRSSIPVTTHASATYQSSSNTVSSSRASSVKSHSTTTASSRPWKVVAFSLSAVSGVLLLAFIITIIILCKMRNKLGQASKTLYPITPTAEDHEYLDLESGTKKKVKKVLRVELKNITSHEEEEFDSPTFSPTPPVKPKRSLPPPIPSSNPPSVNTSDDAPELPSRAKNIKDKSTKEQNRLQHDLGGSKTGFGATNRAFEDDASKGRGSNEIHDEGGKDMYESYEHGFSANSNSIMDDFDDTDIQGPYEEPVKSSANHQMQRQGSSTGLPDLAIQRVSSREQVQDIPLQESIEDEEEFDDEGFETVGPHTGLPGMTAMHNIDDLQYFDDPDAMTAQVNETNEDGGDFQGKDNEDRDVPSPTPDSIDDLLTYDDADMDLANINENEDDGDEPGFYDDFDMNDRNIIQAKTHAHVIEKTNDLSPEVKSDSFMKTNENQSENTKTSAGTVEPGEVELPKVPPRRKSTFDKNTDTTKNTMLNIITPSTAEANNIDQSIIPSVSLRSDLLRTQSEAENASESPPVINMDTFPGEIAQMRSGKNIEDRGNGNPRDSYFLDVMDETPIEFNETTSNNVLLSGKDDITGVAGISNGNGNAHLNDFGETGTGFE